MYSQKTKAEKKVSKKNKRPAVGQESVLNLGYGPINMDYDIKNPKGLWEKVRNGEVQETYLGDGVGSMYTKTPKPWDAAKNAAKAREQGIVVMANPKAKKQTAKRVGRSVDDSTTSKSGINRAANNDSELADFKKAFLGKHEKPVASRKKKVRDR